MGRDYRRCDSGLEHSLTDIGVFTTTTGTTIFYSDTTQKNLFAGKTPLATITGSENTFVGGDFGTAITDTSVSNNTAVGADSLRNLLNGSNNTAVGRRAGNAYVGNESNNIVIGATGTAAESNVTRIGSTQTSAYMAEVYGITPAGTTTTVIMNSLGRFGTVAGSPATWSTFGPTVINTTSPAGFSTTIDGCKVGNMVTIQLQSLNCNAKWT